MRRNKTVRAGCAILALALAFSLAGCGVQQGAANSPQSTAAAQSAAQGEAASDSAQARATGMLFLIDRARGFNTGEALYEYARIAEDAAVIVKTDFATAKQTCICQKEGCAHADASCNAYVGRASLTSMMVLGDKLYLFYVSDLLYEITPELTDEAARKFCEISNNTPSYVEVISTDGTQRSRLMEFPREINIDIRASDGVLAYGSCAASDISQTLTPAQNVWVDLQTGEYGTYEKMGTVVAGIMGVYENKLVYADIQSQEDLFAIENEEQKQAAYRNASYAFYSLDPFTGEKNMLAQYPVISGSNRVFKNRIYSRVGIETDSPWYCLELATGQETLLLEQGTEIAPEFQASYMPSALEAQQQYMACVDSATGKRKNVWLNLDTGALEESALRTAPGPFGDTVPRIVAQANDGRWLITTGKIGESTRTLRSRYAIITQEDFWAGKANVTEVEMYEAL